MLVAIGKGIELDVDVTRFNIEVHDHIVRTGIRNLLMDAHASATAKADPDNYIKRSQEMAETKLASLYAGVVRAQTSADLKRRPIRSVKLSCGWHGKRSCHGLKSRQHRKRIDWPRSIGLRPNTQKSMTRN